MTEQDFISHFKRVKRAGDGYSAQCPAHDDRKNSLTITFKDGNTLLCCHARARCGHERILAGAGLEITDLYTERKISKQSANIRYQGKTDRLADIERNAVAEYPYFDENGKKTHACYRMPNKDFFWMRVDEDGEKRLGLGDTERQPYNLPDIMARKPNLTEFYLVEGQKDADSINSLGILASDLKDWKPAFNRHIYGLSGTIIRDHDKAGIDFARRTAKVIGDAGITVKVIDLFEGDPIPDKHGPDVSDWIAARRQEGKGTEAIAAELRELVVKSRDLARSSGNKPLLIKNAADVVTEKIQWLWYPYIPLKYVTLFSGEEGVGKSWVIAAIASGLTNGIMPLTKERLEPKKVLIFSAEDAAEDAVVPRLKQCGANLKYVGIINERFTLDEDGMLRLRECIEGFGPAWVIIDPLFSYSDTKLDLNKPHHARRVTSEIEGIARELKIAISYLIHFNKSKGQGDARAAVSSSQEFSNAARSILLIGKDAHDESRRAVVHRKSNYAERGKSIDYRITNGADGSATFTWGGESTMTERDLVDRAGSTDEHAEKTEAVAWLQAYLQDGPKDAGEGHKDAKNAGISVQQLRTARVKLGIKPENSGFGSDKKWYWQLPGVANSENQHLSGEEDGKSTANNSLALDVDSTPSQHLKLSTTDSIDYGQQESLDVDVNTSLPGEAILIEATSTLDGRPTGRCACGKEVFLDFETCKYCTRRISMKPGARAAA